MKWVVQSNVYGEEGYDGLLDAIRAHGGPLTTVKVIPFGGGFEVIDGVRPEVGDTAIVMGSYGLSRIAVSMGWKPGSYLQNLDFEVQRSHWGSLMLNYGATVTRFADVPEQRIPFFMRPVHDTKAFTGLVLDWFYYEQWRESILRMDDAETVTSDTLVMVCPRLEIFTETRTWIVGGRVITASGYKHGTIKRYTDPSAVPGYITEFAQACAQTWCPNEAFVLDVAETPLGLKIVEINNINSAGFYRGDMGALVRSLEKFCG